MPNRKSADDIRRQTSRICKEALEGLAKGRMSKAEFSRRVEWVTKAENRYVGNIHNHPQYIIEIRKGAQKADATPYPKSEYMYEGVYSA